jgi:hypothetical protein
VEENHWEGKDCKVEIQRKRRGRNAAESSRLEQIRAGFGKNRIAAADYNQTVK